MTHSGIGYDVHPLVAGRKLILGGVDIPHAKGLDGHSDADALMHAICDAVLGAIGEGDIGTFFLNTDPRWRNAPSKIFLQEAARQVAFRDGRIVNVDATLIAQAPKLLPHIPRMKENIAAALGISLKRVGVKATTNEGLGFAGREEGIAAMAVASVDLPENLSKEPIWKMARTEVSWKRRAEEGHRAEVYAHHIGDRWIFFIRERRFDEWQPYPQPTLADWLELLDGVRRRVNRRLVRPEQVGRVEKRIRELYPEAEIPR